MKTVPLKLNNKEFFQRMYGFDEPPVFPTEVSINIEGVGVCIPVINGLRRVITDELLHAYLSIPDVDNFATTDPYNNVAQFEQQLSQIPLCYPIQKDIKKECTFSLYVINNDINNKIILSGDLMYDAKKTGDAEEDDDLGDDEDLLLKIPKFCPTFPLCILGPGTQIHITNIKIIPACGWHYSGANIASNSRHECLDIPQYSLEEMNMEENRLKTFSHESGYKESSLVAKSNHFLLTFNIRASTNNSHQEAVLILIDACDNIIFRLRSILIHMTTTSEPDSKESDGIQLSSKSNLSNEEIKYEIIIPSETDTIGLLLVHLILEIYPNIIYAKYDIDIGHNLILQFAFKETDDIHQYISDAINHGISIYDNIKRANIERSK
jgi:DNA-directed RNA polymerase subunit L